MCFWDRVIILLEQKDISRKELIISTGIESSLISKGLSDTSTPRTETALKIANYLGTTVEFLVTGKNPHSIILSHELYNFEQNLDDIASLCKLSDENKNIIRQLIRELLNEAELQSKS